jgi:hypothetical protein
MGHDTVIVGIVYYPEHWNNHIDGKDGIGIGEEADPSNDYYP